MLIETELDTSAISEVALTAFSQNEKDAASDFIAHHGIKGQKWGQRRYQNSDGSLTAEGRKRYGVGPALKNAGSAAGRAIGKAVRKATGRQTDAELDAELAKARKVHERKMKVDEINDLTGKKKKLSKMTDQEVDQYINRLSKERTVRQAEKDLKRMNRSDFSNFMSDLRGAAGAGIVEGVKRGVGYQVQKSFEKASDRRQSLKDAKYKEKHKDKLDKEDLKSKADDNRNKLSAYRDEVELKALKGDKDAVKALRTVADAKKGKKKDDQNEPSGEDKPKGDGSKSKKPKNAAVEADEYEIPVTKKDGSVKMETVQRTPTSEETRRWMDEMTRSKLHF